jgi:hypothetical protein
MTLLLDWDVLTKVGTAIVSTAGLIKTVIEILRLLRDKRNRLKQKESLIYIPTAKEVIRYRSSRLLPVLTALAIALGIVSVASASKAVYAIAKKLSEARQIRPELHELRAKEANVSEEAPEVSSKETPFPASPSQSIAPLPPSTSQEPQAPVTATPLIPPLSSSLPESISPLATKRTPLSSKNWSKLRVGDIVFIRSRSGNATLIAALSDVDPQDDADDAFTHCGIVFKDGTEWKVYEGAGRGRWLTLAEWRQEESKRKVNGAATSEPLHSVYAMRWNGKPELATGLDKLLKEAKALHDTEYDRGLSWSDTHAYSSELVWKAFRVGGLDLTTIATMKDHFWAVSQDGAKQIMHKLNATDIVRDYRHGRNFDPNELFVTPEEIYRSSFLIPVTDESP